MIESVWGLGNGQHGNSGLSEPAKSGPVALRKLRAPPLGESLPWLDRLLSVAEQAWFEGQRTAAGGRNGRSSGSRAKQHGAHGVFVRVPLLRVVERVQPL